MNAMMIENLKILLRQFYPVAPEALAALANETVAKAYKRMQYVIRQGEAAPNICFLFSGLYRLASESQGGEDTLCFITEMTPMASLHAIYDGSRAVLSVQTIIPGRGAELPLPAWERLRDAYPSLARCYERMLVKQLYDLERRHIYFANDDIDARYATFMKVRPNFTNRIPLKYIAQYLGVTPETISRVRARLKGGGEWGQNS